MYFSRPFNDSVGRSFGYHGPFDRNLSDGKNPSTEKKKNWEKKGNRHRRHAIRRSVVRTTQAS